ncbi:MAG TPA: ABC transporter permease [Roseiarcus sp.]|jgi:ribose transport system permease protein|nr:ABC transporter permease [Roseiarcus sp.]
MSSVASTARGTSYNTFLLVPILLFFGLLTIAVVRSPNLMTSSGIGSAEIVVAPLILSTYALMATALAGRATVDLSIGPLIGFINVTLIQIHTAGVISSPIAVFAYALFAGVAYQIVFGLIVLWVRVQPIIVSLSGYLALSGINLVILPRPGGSAPEWMANWGSGTTIFSPSIIMVAIATVGWLIFSTTAFYGHLRLMGSDERAAYTSGVRIGVVRIGAHVVCGLFAGLAALAFTGLISSGDPTQGTTYTLIAVTALVLGGTSLAGGRATVFGSLLGALNLFLIGYVLSTFDFGSVQGFVTDLCYGLILVLSLLLTVALPYLQRWLRHVSPLLVFVVLGLLFIGVALHATFDYATLAPHAGAASAPAPDRASGNQDNAAPPRLPPLDPGAFAPVLEQVQEGPGFARSLLSTRASQLAVLLLAIVITLRLMVWQAGKRRMTPLLYAAIGVGGLLGVWLLMDTGVFVAKLGR